MLGSQRRSLFGIYMRPSRVIAVYARDIHIYIHTFNTCLFSIYLLTVQDAREDYVKVQSARTKVECFGGIEDHGKRQRTPAHADNAVKSERESVTMFLLSLSV